MQCSQFAFVCMYTYIYIRHTLIVWAQFLWSRLQTTSYVVLVQPGGDRRVKKIVREPKWSRDHVVLVRPGGDRRVKEIVQEPNWSRSSPSVIMLESENGSCKTCFSSSATVTPPQHVSLRLETRTTLRSLPETLQMTALPSSLLYIVPST